MALEQKILHLADANLMPLSEQQRGMWNLIEVHGNDATFIMNVCFKIKKQLSVEHVKKSLEQLIVLL